LYRLDREVNLLGKKAREQRMDDELYEIESGKEWDRLREKEKE
jgi:hypothetical protein